MANATFYRYVDANEQNQIMTDKQIAPRAGQTVKFYAPDRYDTAADAQRHLALRYTPQFRIGPISGDEIDFDHVHPPKIVAPANSQPGGGRGVATTQTFFLFDCFTLL
jgi:hypothetical protein